MKMSEVFKLPSWVGKFGDGHRGYHVCNGQMSNALFADKCTKKEAEAICKAVNAYDTHLADIDRLLERLEPFAEIGEAIADVPYVNVEVKIGKYKFKRQIFLRKNNFTIAHQTYTELIKIYPKGE